MLSGQSIYEMVLPLSSSGVLLTAGDPWSTPWKHSVLICTAVCTAQHVQPVCMELLAKARPWYSSIRDAPVKGNFYRVILRNIAEWYDRFYKWRKQGIGLEKNVTSKVTEFQLAADSLNETLWQQHRAPSQVPPQSQQTVEVAITGENSLTSWWGTSLGDYQWLVMPHYTRLLCYWLSSVCCSVFECVCMCTQWTSCHLECLVAQVHHS